MRLKLCIEQGARHNLSRFFRMISSGGSLTSLVTGGRGARGSRWAEAGSCSSTSPGRRR